MTPVVAVIIAQLLDPVRIILVGASVLWLAKQPTIGGQMGVSALVSFVTALVIFAVLSSTRVSSDPHAMFSLLTGFASSFIIALIFVAAKRAVRGRG